MALKMECDQCHTQVTAEGIANHGWLMINQVQVVAEMGHRPIQASLCTVACAIEYLKEYAPSHITGEPG